MRFLVDECTGPAVAAWLRSEGHEVFSVYDEARGTNDTTLIQKAYDENWILITNDKDFGEKVYARDHASDGCGRVSAAQRLRRRRPLAAGVESDILTFLPRHGTILRHCRIAQLAERLTLDQQV